MTSLACGFVLAFGTTALFLAQGYLEGQKMLASLAPEAAKPAVPMDTIVVATQPLRFGTEIRSEHLREIGWPAGATPGGSFHKISDLLTDEGRRTVLSPIVANEPVLSWKVTGPGERATLSAVVDDGMRAMSVRINDVLGVAGFVLPGNWVDIMLTRNNDTSTLLQNVKVLAIDQTSAERHDQRKSDTIVTLEINITDTQKLRLAQTVGLLSLALRAEGSVEAPAPRRITIGDLGPAYEIHAGATDGETEEEAAVRLLAKQVESGFKAMDDRIKQMGEEFDRKAQKIKTEAIPFNPNAIPFNPNARSNCASLYAFPCYVDGIRGPVNANLSATGCDVWGSGVATRCRQ